MLSMDACSTMDLSIRHAPRRQEMDEREHAPHAPQHRASERPPSIYAKESGPNFNSSISTSIGCSADRSLTLNSTGKERMVKRAYETSEVKCRGGCHDERGPRDEKRTAPTPTHLHTNSTHSFLPNFLSRSVARFGFRVLSIDIDHRC